jgi:hypothetical protein
MTSMDSLIRRTWTNIESGEAIRKLKEAENKCGLGRKVLDKF